MSKQVVCRICRVGLVVPWPEKLDGPEAHCSNCGAEYTLQVHFDAQKPRSEGVVSATPVPGSVDVKSVLTNASQTRRRKCRKGHEIPQKASRCPICKKDANQRYQQQRRNQSA